MPTSPNNQQEKGAAQAQGESAAANNLRLENVSLDVLHDHPDNDYSMERGALDDLRDSIERDGLAQPPLVREHDGGYQIVAGHRRVACYRELAKENPEKYSTIPVNILSDCDDERALILLDVTNLMVRQLTVKERAKRYERLWNTVPALRDKHPELRGVRTSQVISDIIARETGQSVSRATVDRALAAGKKAQEVEVLLDQYSDVLIKPWIDEITLTEGFSPKLVKEIAARDESVQRQLLADYQRDNLTPKQLEKTLDYVAPKTEVDIERALDQVISTLRDVAAWHKKYGAAVDMYRIEHIRTQLSKITRG